MTVTTKKELSFNVMLTANIVVKKVKSENQIPIKKETIEDVILASAYSYAKSRGFDPFLTCRIDRFAHNEKRGLAITVNCLCKRDNLSVMKSAISKSMDSIGEILYVIFTIHDRSSKYEINDKISELHEFIYDEGE